MATATKGMWEAVGPLDRNFREGRNHVIAALQGRDENERPDVVKEDGRVMGRARRRLS